LVTEFEIRRELAAIESSRLDGVTKVRRLLRIAKRVRSGALTLAHLSLRKLQEGDGDSAARFRAAARRLVDLHDEIRVNARTTLRPCPEETRELMEVMA
jgi:coenzyme F420-reducing hydrogenase alpha subunit